MKTGWTPDDALIAANQTLDGLGELVLEGDEVRLQSGKKEMRRFELVICDRLTPEGTGGVLLEARSHRSPLVACPYVDVKSAEEFRGAEIPFIDSVGNVFLKGEKVLVWQVGAKPVKNEPFGGAALSPRAFQPTGLKFLYEILIRDHALISKTYRELNKLTGASLGAIGWILNSLRENGFLVEIDGKRRLTRKRELLDQWCAAYRQKLRPKQVVGRFTLRNQRCLTNTTIPSRVLIGGETAAAKMVGVIRPELHSLYAETSVNVCVAKLGLEKDDKGDVELLSAFW